MIEKKTHFVILNKCALSNNNMCNNAYIAPLVYLNGNLPPAATLLLMKFDLNSE